MHPLGFDTVPAWGGGLPKVVDFLHSVSLSLGINLFLFFKGLNPGKAIAEIKKMMATYKEKKASA